MTHTAALKAALPAGRETTPEAERDEPAAKAAALPAALYRSDTWETPLAPVTMNAPTPSPALPPQ